MLNDPVLEMTGDQAQLRRAIDGYNVRATGVLRADQLGAHVLTTVGTIARSLAEAGEGRKTIVGIGSGWLLDRPIPPPSVGGDLLPEWIAAMRELSRTNSTFYVIDPGGVGSTRVNGGDNGFARETGGMAFLNTNDLSGRRGSHHARVGQLLHASRRQSAGGRHRPARAGAARVPARCHPPRAPRGPLTFQSRLFQNSPGLLALL